MSSLNQPQFKNPENARQYLERVRWPNGPICPHCGSISKDHYSLAGESTRPGLWKCKDCRLPFTVTVGTVFERSKIALHVWLQAVFLLCSSKKGMSSHQLHRTLGVTYKTAWFMTHRIREAMTTAQLGPIGGSGKIVEADETYFGTEEGKANIGGKRSAARTMKASNKIVTLVERGGIARSYHVADVTGPNLKAILLKQIHAESHVMTDSSPRYNIVKREQPFAAYDQVNHSQREYVRGIAHTNTVEGYFSILKRGLIGTYHHVASAHLFRYTNEFDFRYNHRARLGYTDGMRANAVLREIAGKRLTYRRINAATQAA
ncbi:MAG TPA: IS1595 family transposase [Burkholderiales bacterium]|nr:IS1595 family transposase [Burkholderiales bacterium]